MNKKNKNMKYSQNDKKSLEPALDLEKEEAQSESKKTSNSKSKKNK